MMMGRIDLHILERKIIADTPSLMPTAVTLTADRFALLQVLVAGTAPVGKDTLAAALFQTAGVFILHRELHFNIGEPFVHLCNFFLGGKLGFLCGGSTCRKHKEKANQGKHCRVSHTFLPFLII
jgi:hypothetical protein